MKPAGYNTGLQAWSLIGVSKRNEFGKGKGQLSFRTNLGW